MRLLRALLLVLPMLALTAERAGSHHAFSPVYDAKRTITVEGVVTQFRFVNPHAMMIMDVKDKTGKVVAWNVEFAGRLNLEEAGWTVDSIKPGERVKVTGNPAWKSSQRMAFVKLVRADGTALEPGRAQRLSAVEEERRERAKQRTQQK
jgi:DNA replicative helicase MCM subunit Mcm2 (Cdc46/Mcm family)